MQVDPIGRAALRLMDGTRDRSALVNDLRAWWEVEGASDSDSVEFSRERLEENLAQFAGNGLLLA